MTGKYNCIDNKVEMWTWFLLTIDKGDQGQDQRDGFASPPNDDAI